MAKDLRSVSPETQAAVIGGGRRGVRSPGGALGGGVGAGTATQGEGAMQARGSRHATWPTGSRSAVTARCSGRVPCARGSYSGRASSWRTGIAAIAGMS